MKNNVYPCKPQFYCTKVGFKGVKIIYVCFRDDYSIFYNIMVCCTDMRLFIHIHDKIRSFP